MFLRIMAVLLGLIGLAGVGLALVASQRPVTVQQVVVPPPPVPKSAILVAARPQRAGNLMVAEDLTSIEVPAGQEPQGSYSDSVANRTLLRGAMVRRSLEINEPLVAGDVLAPGDRGFLAAVLGAGMRAVTVGVDSVSGTAGLIWPGDRVDLVLTQSIEDKDQPYDRRVSGETVLSNLRVIAVDQQLVQGGQGGSANPTAAGNANRTVTIEASSFDAQRIVVASRLGRISLVIRSAADNQAANGDAGPVAMAPSPAGTPTAPTGPASSATANGASPAAAEPSGPATLTALSAGAPPATTATSAAGTTTPAGAGADQSPIAWAGDVSPALRDHSGGKGGTVKLYHGPGVTEEVKF